MRFLFILLIFISLGGKAQVWHYKRIIQYDLPIGAEYPDFSSFISFKGDIMDGTFGELPYYSELIPLAKDHQEVSMSIVFRNYETYQGSKADISGIETLNDSIIFSYSVDFMKKMPYLQLQILPFRKNPQTGKLERLKSFAIRVEAIGTDNSKIFGNKKSGFQKNSVLASGSWYKIKVPNSGIYKLSYAQISSMSVGNPENVRIFGAGGEVLPEDYRLGEKDDLSAVQVYMEKGPDGIFNSGDYILFYSKGSVKWYFDSKTGMYRHKINPYSEASYYYVTSGDGPDLPRNIDPPAGIPNKFSGSYDFLTFHEKETTNVLKSGKQWFGEDFTNKPQQTFDFDIPGLIVSKPLKLLTQGMAHSLKSSGFQISNNNLIIDTFTIQAASYSDYTSTYGYTTEKKTVFFPASNMISIGLKFMQYANSSNGFLDYITVNARANLQMNSDYLDFRDMEITSPGNITEFTIKSAVEKTIIWDVSNQNDIQNISGSLDGSELKFKVSTDILREFFAFNVNGNFPSPVLSDNDVGPLLNQDLHGSQQPDLVIICHDKFFDQAMKLASYRREKSGLDVLLVTPDQVYNEFSSGNPDISAYRNFMKMLYDNAGADSTLFPRYLLLFGDGTYDNKGIEGSKSTNYILTYQSENSLSPTSSYVSDDFFALLDPGENMNSGLLDIGVGRLPVKSSNEADSLVSKILGYELPSSMGDWRNSICFIGDDEDGNIHMGDADAIATYVETNYPEFNINKIYLDAFKQVMNIAGQKYPDANRAIRDQIARGALVVNYTGHGGVKGWAHEQILNEADIQGWTNQYRLPLFMTATCEFSRFDNHNYTSAGEKVLLNPKGGGIALLSTTRLVYSQPNRVLNEKLYQIIFERDKDGQFYRLGDIMAYTKNQSGSGINKRNFTLLGDPSQRISYPEYFVYADSVNGKSIQEVTDTLEALKKINISGHVADKQGNLLTSFNGVVYPTVYDKSLLVQTLANDGGTKRTFSLRNNILYKGKSSVENGIFSFTFIVPKDINYAYGAGRVSFYADDSIIDAWGVYDGITIGGTNTHAESDLEGPVLNVYMNNPAFRSGGITDENPMLYVEVTDKNGVNTTGNGIGHDVTAMLDERSQNVFLLNEYYQAYLDNYQGGLIRYPFHDLEPGHHTVSVKVWDIYDNSSSGTTDFIVIKSKDFILRDLLNYPNPFSDYTNISFAHNKAGVDMEITVDIFSMEGKLISTIKTSETNIGYRSQNIYWDGSGAMDGHSIYIYKIKARTSDGQEAEKSGKLLISR